MSEFRAARYHQYRALTTVVPLLAFFMSYSESSIKEQTYDVPDDYTTIVGAERFCCSEVLFQPRFIGSEASEIHGTSCQIDLYGNVVLSGGTMHPYAS